MDNYKDFSEEECWNNYVEATGAYGAFECFYRQNKDEMSAEMGALVLKELTRLENEKVYAKATHEEAFKKKYGAR